MSLKAFFENQKYLEENPEKNVWPRCKRRIDFNNQIGAIHSCVGEILPKRSDEKLILEEKKCPTNEIVLIAENVVPADLATQAAELLRMIPFDVRKRLLNDNANRPKNNVFYEAVQSTAHPQNDRMSNEENCVGWEWEKYDADMWRLAPKTLTAFVNSPLNTLISVLEQKLISTFTWLGALQKSCWVIQRIQPHHFLGPHRDDNGDRQFAFIYYLNSEDWSETDGGKLCVGAENDHLQILPQFNRIVAWDMRTQKSPVHWVKSVTGKKERFALVGFFERKDDWRADFEWNCIRK